MTKKYRYVESRGTIYAIVGYGVDHLCKPAKEYYEVVEVKEGYQREAILLDRYEILFLEQCNEITDKRRIRLIKLLYG